MSWEIGKRKHEDMFRCLSHLLYIPAFTAWRIFTISTKDINSNPLHKRRHKANSQSKSLLYKRKGTKLILLYTRGGIKPNTQSKLEVTIFGDLKDHKQKSHNTKSERIDFAMIAQACEKTKILEVKYKRKHLGKLLEWYKNFKLKTWISQNMFSLIFQNFETK